MQKGTGEQHASSLFLARTFARYQVGSSALPDPMHSTMKDSVSWKRIWKICIFPKQTSLWLFYAVLCAKQLESINAFWHIPSSCPSDVVCAVWCYNKKSIEALEIKELYSFMNKQ